MKKNVPIKVKIKQPTIIGLCMRSHGDNESVLLNLCTYKGKFTGKSHCHRGNKLFLGRFYFETVCIQMLSDVLLGTVSWLEKFDTLAPESQMS